MKFFIFVILLVIPFSCSLNVIASLSATKVLPRIIFSFPNDTEKFTTYVDYFTKLLSQCGECCNAFDNYPVEIFFEKHADKKFLVHEKCVFKISTYPKPKDAYDYWLKEGQIESFDSKESFYLTSVSNKKDDDEFLDFMFTPLTKIILIVLSNTCPLTKNLERFFNLNYTKAPDIHLTNVVLITEKGESCKEKSNVNLIIKPESNLEFSESSLAKAFIFSGLTYNVSLSENPFNIFIFIQNSSLPYFYNFFVDYIYNSPMCSPNTLSEVVKKVYYIQIYLYDLEEKAAHYDAGRSISIDVVRTKIKITLCGMNFFSTRHHFHQN